MGVKGLWKLLMPCGRRISIESLEGRVLAIDASIWLTQFLTVAAAQQQQQERDDGFGGSTSRRPHGGAVGGGRNYDYLVGFLRRLCKLRYQGIRPVLVFDGATPEIKQREIRARRARQKRKRETFLGDGTGDDSLDDDEGIKRLAKRLLLQQLKKAGGNNKKAALLAKKQKQKDVRSSTTLVGSEAPGFNNPDAPRDPDANAAAKTGTGHIPMAAPTHQQPQQQQLDDSMTKTKKLMNEREIIDLLEDDKYLEGGDEDGDGNNGGGGDWDDVVVIDDDDENDDSKQDQQKDQKQPDQQNGFYDKHNKKSLTSSMMMFHGGDGTQFEVEQVASLRSSQQRKDVVEDAQKRRRLQSRREFLKVANDPEGLSQCQLRNFLKSSKLNQDIVQMAKRAAKKEEEEGEDEDEDEDEDEEDVAGEYDEDEIEEDEEDDIFNRKKKIKTKHGHQQHHLKKLTKKKKNKPRRNRKQQRHRIIYEKFSDEQQQQSQQGGGGRKKPTEWDKERELEKYRNQKLSLLYDEKKEKGDDEVEHKDDDDDDDIDWGQGGDDGIKTAFHYSSTTPVKTASRRSAFQDDSEDESDEEGDHNIEDKEETMGSSISKSRRIFLLDDDDDDDDDGEVMDSKVSAKTDAQIAQELQDEQLARDLHEREQDEEEDHSQSELARREDVASSAVARAAGSVSWSSHKTSADARSMQELTDSDLAKSLQEAEYTKGVPENNGGGFFVEGKSDGKSQRMDDAGRLQPIFAEFKSSTLPIDLTSVCDGGIIGSDENEEDDDDDDIEWEDGDDEIEVDGSARMVDEKDASTSTQRIHVEESEHDITLGKIVTSKENAVEKPRGGASECRPTHEGHEDVEDSAEEEDVEWEDGDGESVENSARNEASSRPLQETELKAGTTLQTSPLRQNEKQSVIKQSGDDPDIEIIDVDLLEPEEESNVDVFQQNDWGMSRSKSAHNSKEMEDALQHAQETASNLTNWAGRAFRRAVAQHAEENGLAVPEVVKPKAFETEKKVLSRSKNRRGDDDVPYQSISQSTTLSVGAASLPNDSSNQIKGKESRTEVVDNFEWFKSVEESAVSGAEYESNSSYPTEREISVGSSDPFGGGGITDEMRSEVMQLLRLFGVPYVVAPSEAEAQCVMLEKLKLVDGIVTEDSDTFVFGGQVVFKNIFDDQKYVEVYHARDAADEMNLTRDALVALAMLLGGDYTDGVKGVGIVNGMEVLQAFDVADDCKAGLTRFRKWLDGFDPVSDLAEKSSGKSLKDEEKDDGSALSKERIFHKKHRSARTRWVASKTFPDPKVLNAYLNPVVDTSRDKFTWGTPNVEGLVEFCRRHVGWTPEDTKRLVVPVVEKMERDRGMHQTRLEHFMRYEDNVKFASVRSQRLQDVLKNVKSNQTSKSKPKSMDANETPVETGADDGEEKGEE